MKCLYIFNIQHSLKVSWQSASTHLLLWQEWSTDKPLTHSCEKKYSKLFLSILSSVHTVLQIIHFYAIMQVQYGASTQIKQKKGYIW